VILLAKSKTTLILGLNALNGEHENRLRQQYHIRDDS
jgi:hypothetical protein